jgi:hypothetical protein
MWQVTKRCKRKAGKYWAVSFGYKAKLWFTLYATIFCLLCPLLLERGRVRAKNFHFNRAAIEALEYDWAFGYTSHVGDNTNMGVRLLICFTFGNTCKLQDLLIFYFKIGEIIF